MKLKRKQKELTTVYTEWEDGQGNIFCYADGELEMMIIHEEYYSVDDNGNIEKVNFKSNG